MSDSGRDFSQNTDEAIAMRNRSQLQEEHLWVDKEILIHALRVAEAAKGMAKGIEHFAGTVMGTDDTFQTKTMRKAVIDEVIAADKAIAQIRHALGYTPVE